MTDHLLAFTRCSVSGCEWQVQLKTWMATTRCYIHLGPAVPQYFTAADGSIIQTKFMPREQDPDYEPWPTSA